MGAGMADLYIVRVQRKIMFGRKRKDVWVLHEFFPTEAPARAAYDTVRKKQVQGVRLYSCTMIDEDNVV